MSDLSKNARAAAAMGLSYGKYKALTYNPDQERKSQSKSRRKPQKGKRYSEQEAFNLWQEGKTDEEIFQYMKETYFATDEKIQLSIDIATPWNCPLRPNAG